MIGHTHMMQTHQPPRKRPKSQPLTHPCLYPLITQPSSPLGHRETMIVYGMIAWVSRAWEDCRKKRGNSKRWEGDISPSYSHSRVWSVSMSWPRGWEMGSWQNCCPPRPACSRMWQLWRQTDVKYNKTKTQKRFSRKANAQSRMAEGTSQLGHIACICCHHDHCRDNSDNSDQNL